MYIPAAFVESDQQTLFDFIEHHSFATLISQVDGVPFATHMPLLLNRDQACTSLTGHTARANPQSLASTDQTVLAIFSGPHTYISPTWYEAENVVPTWNYVAVHVYGKLRLIEDKDALLTIVSRTTDYYERSMPKPWVFDRSLTYAERLASQIIGFELEIERIEGKWKINQNHPVERQEKVVQALEQRPGENSRAIAQLMRERLNDAK